MTLTEQWKLGELEEHKKYYCKTKWFEDIFQASCYNKDTDDEWWVLKNEKYNYNNIYHTEDIEVLAPVPSYEEYNRLKEVERKKGKLVNVNYKIKQENQQLKELLLDCRFILREMSDVNNWLESDDCVLNYDMATECEKYATRIDNAIGEK